MALLNPSPVLALPTAMWITFRAIAEFGPLTETELFALTSPPAIRTPTGDDDALPTHAAREAYRALRDHGMVETDERGRVAAVAVKITSYAAFCAALRSLLLSRPVSGPPLDESGANDLLRALTWLLTTDPISDSWNESRAAQERVPAGQTLVFVNSIRWNGFRFWAEALGFAQEPVAGAVEGGASLIANPTRALRDFVTSTYAPGDDLPASRLLDDFRAAVPVVPGGAVSRALGYARDPREVDRATTYAMESGRARGWLSLERRADAADTVLLAGLDKPGSVRAVSHVVIGEVVDV